ncbi:hypothetical protein LTS18_013260, partial [Coniosporium uncinatum]
MVARSSSTDLSSSLAADGSPVCLIQKFVGRDLNDRKAEVSTIRRPNAPFGDKQILPIADKETYENPSDVEEDMPTPRKRTVSGFQPASMLLKACEDSPNPGPSIMEPLKAASRPVQDFNDRLASQRARKPIQEQSESTSGLAAEDSIPSISNTPVKPRGTPNHVQNAFDVMRPKRTPQEEMTVTIGNATTVMTLDTPPKRRRIHTPKNLNVLQSSASPSTSRRLRAFAAEGSQLEVDGSDDDSSEGPGSAVPKKIAAPETDDEAEDSAGQRNAASLTRNETHEGARTHASSSGVLPVAADDGFDDEYIDEAEKKAREEARVAQIIAEAEQAAARPTQDNIKRAASVLRSRLRKDSTLRLVRFLDTSISNIEQGLTRLTNSMAKFARECDIDVPDQ